MYCYCCYCLLYTSLPFTLPPHNPHPTTLNPHPPQLLSGGSMSLILPIMTFFQLGILTEWMRAVTRLGDFYNESVKNTKFAVGGDEGNGETGGAGGRGVEMGGGGGERAAAPMAA